MGVAKDLNFVHSFYSSREKALNWMLFILELKELFSVKVLILNL